MITEQAIKERIDKLNYKVNLAFILIELYNPNHSDYKFLVDIKEKQFVRNNIIIHELRRIIGYNYYPKNQSLTYNLFEKRYYIGNEKILPNKKGVELGIFLDLNYIELD